MVCVLIPFTVVWCFKGTRLYLQIWKFRVYRRWVLFSLATRLCENNDSVTYISKKPKLLLLKNWFQIPQIEKDLILIWLIINAHASKMSSFSKLNAIFLKVLKIVHFPYSSCYFLTCNFFLWVPWRLTQPSMTFQ